MKGHMIRSRRSRPEAGLDALLLSRNDIPLSLHIGLAGMIDGPRITRLVGDREKMSADVGIVRGTSGGWSVRGRCRAGRYIILIPIPTRIPYLTLTLTLKLTGLRVRVLERGALTRRRGNDNLERKDHYPNPLSGPILTSRAGRIRQGMGDLESGAAGGKSTSGRRKEG